MHVSVQYATRLQQWDWSKAWMLNSSGPAGYISSPWCRSGLWTPSFSTPLQCLLQDPFCMQCPFWLVWDPMLQVMPISAGPGLHCTQYHLPCLPTSLLPLPSQASLGPVPHTPGSHFRICVASSTPLLWLVWNCSEHGVHSSQPGTHASCGIHRCHMLHTSWTSWSRHHMWCRSQSRHCRSWSRCCGTSLRMVWALGPVHRTSLKACRSSQTQGQHQELDDMDPWLDLAFRQYLFHPWI